MNYTDITYIVCYCIDKWHGCYVAYKLKLSGIQVKILSVSLSYERISYHPPQEHAGNIIGLSLWIDSDSMFSSHFADGCSTDNFHGHTQRSNPGPPECESDALGPLHNYVTLEGGWVVSLKTLRNVTWVGGCG